MTVVIHEFEVVAEPQQGVQQPAAPAQPGVAAPAPPLTPYEIERIVRRQQERFARVRAY